MKKRYKLLVLVFFVLMLVLSLSACSEKDTKGLIFNLINGDTEYEVSVGTATELGYTKIVIPSKYKNKPVTSIARYGFSDNLSGNDKVRTNNITNITIPSSVTTIGVSAFSGCTGLTNITIPHNVKVIDGSAFSGCSGLTSIVIPSSVIDIGHGVFWGCSELASIIVDVDNAAYKSDANCIIKKDGNTLIAGCKNSIISPSVTIIETASFAGCSGLTSITIPSSVTYIGDYAFGFCSGLTSITIPSSITFIGNNAFADCSALTDITIPSSVIFIETLVFLSCKSLVNVTILSSVTTLGYGLFWDCSALTSISIPISVKNIVGWTFEGCSALTIVYYGGENSEAWEAIEKGAHNDALNDATIYYYSKTQKTGNYWRYVDGVPTKWN